MKRVFMVFIILIAIIGLSTVFTVDETRQVVILQFGEPVRIIKTPGLNFKLPAPLQVANVLMIAYWNMMSLLRKY
ncbi:MAG: hypothetical protein CM1200mP10_09560 [Candidatus Neomarinimicrobiota bacterium]|nr:MAG: hypothetical protein CM1200mP10_09560 [Candidatus Neomarinimicrobiota bacterium]